MTKPSATSKEASDLIELTKEELEALAEVCESIYNGAASHLQNDATGALIEHAARRGEEIADRTSARVEELKQTLQGGAP